MQPACHLSIAPLSIEFCVFEGKTRSFRPESFWDGSSYRRTKFLNVSVGDISRQAAFLCWGLNDTVRSMVRTDSVPRAVAWMLLSGMAFSCMSVLVKWTSQTIPQPWLVFSRGFVMLVMISAWGWWTGEVELRPKGVRILVIRGIAGFLGVTSLFYAVSHLPLPIASVLNWCSPLFVVLFSRLFLNEHIPPRATVFVGLAFLALTQVVGLKWQGELTSQVPLFPALVALGGAAAAGVAYTAIRAASARFTSATIIFHFSWIATLLAVPWIVSTASPFDWHWIPALLSVGLFATCGQIAMTAAYRWAPAPAVSTMSLFNAPFSALAGFLVFGELLGLQQWLGILGLIVSISFVAYLQHQVSARGAAR